MRIRNICQLATLFTALFASPGAWAACLPDAPVVTEDDLLHPPQGMLVFRAQIIKILPHGRMSVKPHRGFGIDYKVLKFYQGEVQGDLISVEYGGCQNLPGKVGDIINVLAMQDRNVDWFAPEFWKRNE